MVIEIAGVAVEVICTYPQNERFLSEYSSDQKPVFAIRPTAEDRARVQADFNRMASAEGVPTKSYAESFLENNAIHALLAEELTAHHVLLLHGSALCMDGEAYIFTARSGVGKSTHARLWREVFGERVWMINDDKPMLRVEEEGVTVYGTPWDGKHHLSRNACAPLRAIVSLERSEVNHLAPLAQTSAFQLLMKHAYASRNTSTMAQILALERQLLRSAEFYVMHCNMTPEAAQIAWQGICQGDATSRIKG